MSKPTGREVLAFARFQRAINHAAVAMHEREQALLARTDSEVVEAAEKLAEAKQTVAMVIGRAIAERLTELRAQGNPAEPGRPGPLEADADDDDDFDQTADEQPDLDLAAPAIQHRVLQGSTSRTALCGASMDESTPNAPQCPECNRVLEGRLGTITHTSPTFR